MGTGRFAFVNGEIVPEEDARMSIFDSGFLVGQAIYDTERTFSGRVLMLEAHIARLFRSCKYVGLDPVHTADEWIRLTHEVIERNLPLLGPHDDFWVTQRVSRGVQRDGFPEGITTIIDCYPLPLRQRARFYRDGVPVVTSTIRRTPPWAQSPQAKTHSNLNLVLAENEVESRNPGAWPILLDENGNLAEGHGSNIFIVRNGEVLTPYAQYVLPGISRATVIELCSKLGLTCSEADVGIFEASAADEAFLTSTSFCLCPVASINSYPIGDGKPWGPITSQLLKAYDALVGIDIKAQYLAHLR